MLKHAKFAESLFIHGHKEDLHIMDEDEDPNRQSIVASSRPNSISELSALDVIVEESASEMHIHEKDDTKASAISLLSSDSSKKIDRASIKGFLEFAILGETKGE